MSHKSNPYPRLSVKNLKSCRGREGYAYSAILCFDGKEVGEVSHDGNGGDTDVYFVQRGKNARARTSAEDQQKVLAYVKEQPVVVLDSFGDKLVIKASLGWVVSQVCETAMQEKADRAACRTKVMFRVEGQAEGEWYAFKGIFKGAEQKWKDVVMADCSRRGLKLVEILNERFV